MQEYLKRNAGLLKSKIRGLFVVCGNRMEAPALNRQNYLSTIISPGFAGLFGSIKGFSWEGDLRFDGHTGQGDDDQDEYAGIRQP